jgi:hypothetical protein
VKVLGFEVVAVALVPRVPLVAPVVVLCKLVAVAFLEPSMLVVLATAVTEPSLPEVVRASSELVFSPSLVAFAPSALLVLLASTVAGPVVAGRLVKTGLLAAGKGQDFVAAAAFSSAIDIVTSGI